MESKKETIFIVDDEPTNISILNEIFPKSYAIKVANSGITALKTITIGAIPDIILLDIMIPDINGYTVCAKIKENKSLADIPIIFISSLDATIDKVRAFKSGAIDYITKPFQPEEVIVRVETHLKLRRYTHQLQENIVQMKNLEKARDNLIHMIIHDMRSPLNGVSGFLQMAINSPDGAIDETRKSYLEKAYSITCIVTEMTNSLLDIQKIEEDKMQLNIKKNNIKETICEAVDLLGGLKEKCPIIIEKQNIDILVKYDRDLIKRVILNLVCNAVKYTSIQESIVIKYNFSNSFLYVSITDHGVGVPKEYQEKIFEKFEQVKIREGGEVHSAGLGLTFCKMAIEAHNGNIHVQNEKEKGCTFTFELPM